MTLSDIALLKLIAESNFDFLMQEPEIKEYLEKFKRFNVIKYLFLSELSHEERFKVAMRMFFARENSPFLQRFFPRHRWGIFLLT